jgi:DNA-directed RNA polymerase subunit RPC12/RpoP
MGFFGFLCAKCEKPVIAENISRGYEEWNRAVAVTPYGQSKGSYDGYGRLSGEEVGDHPRLLHEKCFREVYKEHQKRGPIWDYDCVPVSKSDPGQSYSHSRRDLFNFFGEPDRTKLHNGHFVCIKCKHLWKTKWDLACPVCKSEEIDPIVKNELVYDCSLCKRGFIEYDDPEDRVKRCKECGKIEPGSLTHMDPFNILQAIAWAAKEPGE